VPVCGVLELPLSVESPGGEYQLKLDFWNAIITIRQEQTADNIRFDISSLMENFEYTGEVITPSGEPISIEVDGETYDCIKFKTILNVANY
jgi:hypothetical protein